MMRLWRRLFLACFLQAPRRALALLSLRKSQQALEPLDFDAEENATDDALMDATDEAGRSEALWAIAERASMEELPSIFCWMVVRPGTEEVQELLLHLEYGSTSHCAALAVFSNVTVRELLGSALRGAGPEALRGLARHITNWDHAPAIRGPMTVGTHTNPDVPGKGDVIPLARPIFDQAHDEVLRTALHHPVRRYQWFAKIDSDTALRTDLLQSLLMLRGLRGDADEVLLANWQGSSIATECARASGGLMVYSRRALERYSERRDFCHGADLSNRLATLDWQLAVEDTWLNVCFQKIGVRIFREPHMLMQASDYCVFNSTNKECPWKVAMHPTWSTDGFKNLWWHNLQKQPMAPRQLLSNHTLCPLR